MDKQIAVGINWRASFKMTGLVVTGMVLTVVHHVLYHLPNSA